jgi:hypothetical protein
VPAGAWPFPQISPYPLRLSPPVRWDCVIPSGQGQLAEPLMKGAAGRGDISGVGSAAYPVRFLPFANQQRPRTGPGGMKTRRLHDSRPRSLPHRPPALAASWAARSSGGTLRFLKNPRPESAPFVPSFAGAAGKGRMSTPGRLLERGPPRATAGARRQKTGLGLPGPEPGEAGGRAPPGQAAPPSVPPGTSALARWKATMAKRQRPKKRPPRARPQGPPPRPRRRRRLRAPRWPPRAGWPSV